MQVVAANSTGFYASYVQDHQVTLQRYDQNAQLLWAIAVLPRTPQGQTSRFLGAVLLHNKLYVLSTFSSGGRTRVFAQHISETGNYNPQILVLGSSVYGSRVLFATEPNKATLLLVQTGETSGPASVTLLSKDLKPRWTEDLKTTGRIQEVLLKRDGSSFILTWDGATAPATAAFQLYRFSDDGRLTNKALGHEQYRPLQARLLLTPGRDVVVAGYIVPATSVVTQNPEPKGTFYYRLPDGKMPDPVISFSLFDTDFILDYKRHKPDDDHSQRLRSLQLGPLIPAGKQGATLIGEVTFAQAAGGYVTQNHDDILMTSLSPAGTPTYITTINKEQHSPRNAIFQGSYFATAIGDTLHLLYLNFRYADTAENNEEESILPEEAVPVHVTVAPDGSQQLRPLQYSVADSAASFYLRPPATFQVSEREYIVLGIGKGYYRYGRMRF